MAYDPDDLTPITPLDTFRRIFQWNPRHFWGWAGTGRAKITAKCSGLLREYGWQDQDAAARSGIREALAAAEQQVARYLRYRIGPQYAEATVPYPKLGDLRYGRSAPAGADGRRLAIALPEGELRTLGVEARTIIGDVAIIGSVPYVGASPAPPYLVYRDRDGDGLPDQFEVGIATTVTEPTELGVYVAAADRWDGSALSERWRLTPARATISGGVATIVGPAWAAARPVLWEGEGSPLNGLDPEAAGNYLPAMTVARRYTDPGGTAVATAQATLIWESPPWPGFACCPATGSDPAATAVAVARVGVRDAEIGLVTPAQAIYDATSGTWTQVTDWAALNCREPDRVTIRYLAGLPLSDDHVPAEIWAKLICRLAAADLARPVCSCQDANKLIAHWQADLAQVGAGDQLFATPPELANPLGTRRGQLFAWRTITDQQLRPGISA